MMQRARLDMIWQHRGDRSGRSRKTGLFASLTTEPNAEVGAVHPKAMPVILTTTEQLDAWMTAPATEVAAMQRPLPDGALRIVARGAKQDGLAELAAPVPPASGLLL